MPTTQISEALAGTVDGSNRIFTSSEVPNSGTLQVFVNMEAVTVASIDATVITLSAAPALHSQVFASYLYSSPDDIDLTTLAAVKTKAEVLTSKEDGEIQAIITAFSRYVYNRTGRQALKTVQLFTGIYDGNGGVRFFPPEWPIVSIESLQINGIVQTISPGYNQAGVTISSDARSIAFVSSGSGWFSRGVGNIYLEYHAGYDGIPVDLEMACREACSIAYKKKAWQDLKSKSMSVQGGAGTTAYQSWELPPHVDRIIESYVRKVLA